MNDHTNKTEKTSRIGRRVLLLFAAVITALAVAVTCALTIDTSRTVSVNEADNAEVQTSTTYTNPSGDYSAAAKLRNGDVLNFTGVTYYTITLPKGEYKLEAWGAQGGQGYSTVYGGYGGYSYGTLTLTDAKTTLYIYVGGKGNNYFSSTGSITGGGYNGGGGVRSAKGTGGGGASDIRVGTNTLYYRILVAGGGGGGGYSNTNNRYKGVGGGASGTANGNTGITNYSYGFGASQTAGGGRSSATYTNYTTYGTPTDGSFGQGGSGIGRSSGGGGGGGGWYGGGGGCYAGGGGGSGVVLSTSVTSATAALPASYFGSKTNTAAYYKYRMTGANTATSTRTGNGQVTITVNYCNLEPTSQNYNYPTVKPRGGNAGISIAASTLAKDPDYANISGGNTNNVYFTLGSGASGQDTAPTANNGLYLNAACTVNASSYLTYSWSGITTLNITSINKLPRAGVDGQADNKFTLYTRIRDQFGTNTTRGVAVVSFTMSVTNNNIAAKGAHYSNNRYKFGSSNDNTNATFNYASNYADGKIYNPQGTGRTTLFIPKPMSPTDTAGYTINASEIFSDADTAYDKVAFKSITVLSAYSSYSKYYTLTLNSDSTYATGLFPSFTVKPSGVRPTGAPYVVMTVVAQSSETSSKAAVGNTVTIDLVFRISNTRAYFGATEVLAANLRKAEPVVNIAPGETKSLKLNDMLYDPDDGATIRSTFAQGAADLKVPTNEYIQVDATNTAVPLANVAGSNYYNKTTINTTAGQLSSVTGEGTTATHFVKSSVAAKGSNGEATANVTYRYIDSQTIEFTGRTATQNQYRKADGTLDTSRTGHFYILVRIVDPSDPSDNGIWFPIAISVSSVAPTEPATFANVSLKFADFSAGDYDNAGNSGANSASTVSAAYFTPLSYLDAAGNLHPVGTTSKDGAQGTAPIAFAVDRDAMLYNNALNDFVFIDTSKGDQTILDNGDDTTGTFFRVETFDLYANKSYFAALHSSQLAALGISNVEGNNEIYSFKGLKVTPLRATNNEYFQFRVNVKDTHNLTSVLSICVRVENRDVSPRLAPSSGGNYRINGLQLGESKTPYGKYETNDAVYEGSRVNYYIEVMDELQITPYDFAYDFDIDPAVNIINTRDKYNSNPMNDGFADVSSYVNRTYNIAHTANPATSAADKATSPVSAQKLDFANRSNITAYGDQYSNYIRVDVKDTSVVKTENADGTVTTNTYAIPSIVITGVSRTTSAILQLSFTVSDGFTTSDFNIIVTVLNSAPMLNTAKNHPTTDTDRSRIVAPYNFTAFTDTTSTITPNVRTFSATQIAYDKDGDTPTFDSESIRIVAKDGDNYYDKLYFEAGAYHGYDSTMTGKTPSVTLSDYISANITKGSGGADVIRIQGLSSTEIFNLPVYVEFVMRDGYRAQPKQATLYLLVNVENSNPTFVTDGLLKDSDSDKYTWLINYDTASEIAQKRYIFNSKELHDAQVVANNNALLTIPTTNKIYLFDDADTQQHALLNPYAYNSRFNLVKQFDNRVTDNTGKIDDSKTKVFTQAQFASEYPNAAVVYTPMYEKSSQGNNLNDLGYINVTIRFFYKDGDVFREYANNIDDEGIRDCEYWAIEIEDTHTSGDRRPIQFAISVMDNHHGKTLYTTANKENKKDTANSSELKTVNFYYNYSQPGILAMHTYYRTDGNAESKMFVNGLNANDGYLVDAGNIVESDLDKSSQAGFTAAADKQGYLATAKFADDFKYKYFERTYSVVENNETRTYATYKHYPDTKFTYSPIKIEPGLSAEVVPMSYIALPKGAGAKTEGSTHVTFANAGNSLDAKNGIVLLDSDYATKWREDNSCKNLIYQNITVSDGTKTYSVADNPYINISYVASTNGNPITTEGKYLNRQRFTLSKSGTDAGISPAPISDPDYREDKYGFSISKKEGGPRAPGMLKITLALKTIGSSTAGTVEMVDVEVDLLNFTPTTLEYQSAITGNKVSDANSTYVVETSVSMSMGNTGNSTISLVNESLDAYKNGPSRGNEDKIFYIDPDTTDTLKFYMPSAFATTTVVNTPGEGGDSATQTVTKPMLSEAEIARLEKDRGDGTNKFAKYYNTSSASNVGTGANQINPYTYNPNPGYSTFFDVSPSAGSSDSLQFIPRAKIPANQTDEYYKAHHLEKDTRGNYYYPFRVLFYDECRGTAFTQGYWYTAIIRVYITNDAIKVNNKTVTEKYTPSRNADKIPDEYKNSGKYRLNLSMSTALYVDVSSLLIDNDIVLTSSGSMATKDDTAWTDLSSDEQHIKDYLVMPDVSAKKDLTQIEYNKTSDLPFTIAMGGNEGYTNLPYTTLVFKANSAFKEERNIGFEFQDSNGTKAYIVFNINYNNDAPTPNSDTFGGSNTIDLTLKTGDAFYLYAGDYTQFENDKSGGFEQYDNVLAAYNASTNNPAASKASAADMKKSFKYFTSVYGNAGPEGNSLVLGSDDAASTLRIIGFSIVEKGYTAESIRSLLNISAQMQVGREDNGQASNLRLAVVAGGAITATIKVTLADAKGITVDVNVKVNVLSTAPEAKTSGLPSGVTYDNGAYAISLKYGEYKQILLSGIMTDVDNDDVNSLDVYANMGGNQFNIEHPGSAPVVTALVYTDSGSNNYVRINAIDFIDRTGEVATVSFRVVDRHGAISDTVTIRVSIEPQTVTSVVAANKSLDLKVMSYAEYIDVDNAFEAQELKIVENANATLFKDADFDAASAEYDVEVYVLLKQSESGAFNNVQYTPGQSVLLYSRHGSAENTNTTDIEALYVQDFFTISATEDGKSLLFTPNAVTIRQGATISSIPLYVVVKKRYADSTGGTNTMKEVGAKLDVTVNNSGLMATENSSLNLGYPTVNGAEDLRDSEFLTFTGSKGDSLTWKLYDLENVEHGLFYDYDMLNMVDGNVGGGNEIIKYLDSSYTVDGEAANSGLPPVLNVSIKGEGKYQELTITINRNVTTGQPPAGGLENAPKEIKVYIYAVDAVNNVVGVNKNDPTKVARTVITVNVENDKPEIAETGLVVTCPFCGKTDNVRQNSARTALCSSCNKSFKSLDPDQLGYKISHSAEAGYVLDMTLENGKSQNVNIADIIDDADIDMDAYVMLFTGSTGADLGTCLMRNDGNPVTSVSSDDDSVFNVAYQTATNAYNVSTLSYITFTCRSVKRGDVALCNIKFRDSYKGSETSVLTIRLTVGNIAPTAKPDAKLSFTVMGVGSAANDEAEAKAAMTFSILDFITDANGDNFDPLLDANQGRRPTYTYIDEIVVYGSDAESASNRPNIYGPKYMGEVVNEDTGETQIAPMVESVCRVGWAEENNDAHQKFTITPYAGIYGVQKIVLRIYDSGYEAGMSGNITDGVYYDLRLTITIANPLEDVPDVLEKRDMVYGVTRTILAEDLLGKENAQGYTISNIEEIGTHNLRILKPNESGNIEGDEGAINDWRIYAYTESVSAEVKITFITSDGVTRERTVPINVVANNKPQLKNNTSSYRYTLSMLDDRNQRTIKIKPTDWFEDNDLEDVMSFITPVASSQSVKVEVHRVEEGDEVYLLLKFHRRGESVITVNVADLSGRSYTFDITVECTDAPELSWWEDFVSLIEANWMWFWIIVAAALVLIILLIVIIVVVCKKRKMRREIEALLESETELEEEMMRLSSGAAAYQSFGYLPPTPQNTMDPGMMLGGGAGAPQPNSLQLNAGIGMLPPQNPAINNIPGSAPTARPAPQQPQTPPRNDGFDPNDF